MTTLTVKVDVEPGDSLAVWKPGAGYVGIVRADYDAAIRAEERDDILAGVREHVKACEIERAGKYPCIHGIDSATGTVVLRLAELHRDRVKVSALLSPEAEATS